MDYDPTTENETPWEDKGIDHDDDDDDDEEVDTTRPFQPGAASTPYQPPGAAAGPYHSGEAHEMTHFGPEEVGISDTTPLFAQDQRERAWNTTTELFPDASATDLEAFYDPRSKKLMIKMAGAGYPLYTVNRLTKRLRLNQSLSLEIKMALGQSAEEQLFQRRQDVREADQRVQGAQRLQKTLNETAAKQQQAAQETKAKEAELEQINQRNTNMENEGGTVIERQNEIDRLKRQMQTL